MASDNNRDISRRPFRVLRQLCGQTLLVVLAITAAALSAQGQAPGVTDYVVGPQDVLLITSYDQADLSGKFAVEADGTFTYPLIGRLTAGGLSLRVLETQLKKRLKDEGFFNDPQVTVSVETYKSQKLFVVGEVRTPGSYPLSGDMSLVEALARAGSTLPTASGEVVIVRAAAGRASGPVLPTDTGAADIVRVELKELQNGTLGENAALRDGDTIFVPRAESVYVFGQVRNPGAYTLQQRNTSVMQALSLAGGLTDVGSSSRIKIVRLVNGDKQEISVKLGDSVLPGDTIIVRERFF
jgi:polysaccharide biosynthesis/export protein